MEEEKKEERKEREAKEAIDHFARDVTRTHFALPPHFTPSQLALLENYCKNYKIFTMSTGTAAKQLRLYKNAEDIPAGTLDKFQLEKIVGNEEILKKIEKLEEEVYERKEEGDGEPPLYFVKPSPFIRQLPLLPEGKITKKIIKEGNEGEEISPKKGDRAIIHYELFSSNGAVFDSSFFRNNYFLFQLGNNDVIGGFESAVLSMKIGEISEFEAANDIDLGFGKLGLPPRVLPGGFLFFRIYLLFLLPSSLPPPKGVKEGIEGANQKKESGNKNFQQKAYRKAMDDYYLALNELNFKKLSEEEEAEISIVKIPILLNLAACSLKLREFSKTLSFCSSVIKLDRNNVKALFRMGEAYLSLNEIEPAKEYLLRAYHLNKNDSNIKKLLRTAIDLEKKQLEKQKQIFGSFFSAE